MSIGMTKCYVERRDGEYWYAGYRTKGCSAVVIEAEEYLNAYGLRSLKVLNPAAFAKKWPTVCPHSFIECSGPARKLNYNEYVLLVHSLLPNRKLPVAFTRDTSDKKNVN